MGCSVGVFDSISQLKFRMFLAVSSMFSRFFLSKEQCRLCGMERSDILPSLPNHNSQANPFINVYFITFNKFLCVLCVNG